MDGRIRVGHSMAKHPKALIAEIDAVIKAAVLAGQPQTAALLRAARLDLLLRVHNRKPSDIDVASYAGARGAQAVRKRQSSP